MIGQLRDMQDQNLPGVFYKNLRCEKSVIDQTGFSKTNQHEVSFQKVTQETRKEIQGRGQCSGVHRAGSRGIEVSASPKAEQFESSLAYFKDLQFYEYYKALYPGKG